MALWHRSTQKRMIRSWIYCFIKSYTYNRFISFLKRIKVSHILNAAEATSKDRISSIYFNLHKEYIITVLITYYYYTYMKIIKPLLHMFSAQKSTFIALSLRNIQKCKLILPFIIILYIQFWLVCVRVLCGATSVFACHCNSTLQKIPQFELIWNGNGNGNDSQIFFTLHTNTHTFPLYHSKVIKYA